MERVLAWIASGVVAWTLAGCASTGAQRRPAAPAPRQPKFILSLAELPGFRQKTAPHFEFFFTEGDMDDSDFAFMEAFLVESAQKLGVRLPDRPIRFYKFRSEPSKRALTGAGGNGAAGYSSSPEYGRIPFVHTIYRREQHEVTHVLMNNGRAPACWLAEGIAMLMTETWHGADLRDAVRQLIAQGRYVPMATLVQDRAFNRIDTDVTYPEAGAFVRFLVQTRGLPTFVELYRKAPRTYEDPDATRLRDLFAKAYGAGVEAIEEAWLKELGR
jgi:hypothetical protein